MRTKPLVLSLFALASIGACSSGGDERSENLQSAGGSGNAAGSAASGGLSPDGAAGSAGTVGGAFAGGSAGTAGSGGASGSAGTIEGDAAVDAAGSDGGDAAGAGPCCPNADCLCRGPAPTGTTSDKGAFTTARFSVSTGTVHYPTDAEPPFASVAVGTHFLSSGPEMGNWGLFYASHGIVTIVATASTADTPEAYATKLLAAVEQLKAENTRSGSPLMGKLADRYGVMGHSVGAGASTLASEQAPALKSSVGLAPWGGSGTGVQVPTLLFCGEADQVAPCDMTREIYDAVPASTPKLMVSVPGATHQSWFDQKSAGTGTSGETALAFQKVFLEGDQRWKRFLLATRGTATTNLH